MRKFCSIWAAESPEDELPNKCCDRYQCDSVNDSVLSSGHHPEVTEDVKLMGTLARKLRLLIPHTSPILFSGWGDVDLKGRFTRETQWNIKIVPSLKQEAQCNSY
jgi:hypothetical protein